jgi:hypothetical protein
VEKRRLAGAKPSAEKLYRSINKMTVLTPFPLPGGEQMGGKRRGVPVKTLKKLLKKAGLKTSGKKAALTRRAKQAKLVKKGGNGDGMSVDTTQLAKVKTAQEEAEEAKKAAEAAENTATMVKGGRKRKSRSKKGMGMGVYY